MHHTNCENIEKMFCVTQFPIFVECSSKSWKSEGETTVENPWAFASNFLFCLSFLSSFAHIFPSFACYFPSFAPVTNVARPSKLQCITVINIEWWNVYTTWINCHTIRVNENACTCNFINEWQLAISHCTDFCLRRFTYIQCYVFELFVFLYIRRTSVA